MDFTNVTKALTARGFKVSSFETAKEAAEYLNTQIDGATVGFGGSITLEELGLYALLSGHNTVFSHWHLPEGVDAAALRAQAAGSEHYLLSANGIAETGEIINIDGAGNRVASAIYGHKKVWIIAGKNKLAPTYDEALWRARNIAAPKNAQRLHAKTPCAVKKRILLLAAALCLLCSGCGGGLLEREWSSVTPHSAGYWENGDKDTLRADSYQDAVNAILMLVANHAERGVVRCYFGSDAEYAELAAEACNEVQQETDLGAYLLDYITYAGTDERGFYELSLSFGYRRTAEEQESIINATSTEAIPDLLRAAAAEGADRLVVRVSYFSTDRAGVEQMVRDMQEEKDGGRDAGMLAAPWQVSFYPDTDEPGIVEILLK